MPRFRDMKDEIECLRTDVARLVEELMDRTATIERLSAALERVRDEARDLDMAREYSSDGLEAKVGNAPFCF